MTELGQEKNTVLHKTCNRLTDENEEYKNRIHLLDRDIELYRTTVLRLEKDKAEMLSDIKSVKSDWQELKEILEEMISQVGTLEKENEQHKKIIQDLEVDLAAMTLVRDNTSKG